MMRMWKWNAHDTHNGVEVREIRVWTRIGNRVVRAMRAACVQLAATWSLISSDFR